jgi:general secretion pathway protein A
MPNFFDRISFSCSLRPFDQKGVEEMITFRLRQAGYKKERPLFSEGSIAQIYRYTQGYPRQISILCHKALKKLVMYGKEIVDEEIIKEIIEEEVKLGCLETKKSYLLLKNNF